MKVLGIIAEYNPFHNGHLYQLQEAKKTVSPDYVICVMSGDFLQRGEPALFDKYTRARLAISGGIDAVYELPSYFACGSAEEFANASILSLKQLSVTHLAFGAECDDLSLLKEIAIATSSENTLFRSLLRQKLSEGMTYAKAYSQAFCEASITISSKSAAILEKPNNLLAICYLRAIQKYAPFIEPVLVPRKKAGYHDLNIQDTIASASAIRNHIQEKNPRRGTPEYDTLLGVLPFSSGRLLPVHEDQLQYIRRSDFDSMLRFQWQNQTPALTKETYDFPLELANRMHRRGSIFMGFEELVADLKTKKYTYTRISRALIHLLLSMRQSLFLTAKQNGYIFYVRLLGFRISAAAFIKYQRENCQVPCIQKVSEKNLLLNQDTCPIGCALFEADLHASDIYRLAWYEKYNQVLPSDYEKNALIYEAH